MKTDAKKGPEVEAFSRGDGTWVVQIDTNYLGENEYGPFLTVYLNDAEEPLFENYEKETL